MTETSMMTKISAEIFSGINGASMGLFETGFRIFISATVLSESAVDLVHLISQTEVSLFNKKPLICTMYNMESHQLQYAQKI